MKKLLALLLILPLFAACSDDKDEPSQDYTSFVFYTNENVKFGNCVAAYLDKNNDYRRIAEVGNFTLNSPSKEIRITDESVSEIYLFTGSNIKSRLDAVYKLKQKKKNSFEIIQGTKGLEVFDETDSKQYPQ